MKKHLISITLLFISAMAVGQDLSNLHVKRILLVSDTTFIDSLLVVPSSIFIEGYDSSDYRLITKQSAISWNGDLPSDSITIWYRTYPKFLVETYRNKSPDMIDAYLRENPFGYVPKNDRYLRTQEDDIRTMGNISRGIGFGNKQDVVVNSNLNLRLSGTIQNEVEILAAISDENNPIQPEGNTQQIQEFDRVFVQLKKDSSQLTAGDFQMITPDGSYFMKYNKKSRGIQILHSDSLGKGSVQLSGEGAVSRGRFSRNTITGIEGNQGPYRLQGSNGEIFIIIISGTEQVYLDGELLLRGEQNDYVINYNSGELTFMPKRLITKYSRIVVEFQYSDRNYGRSVFRTGVTYQQDKWKIKANYFSEQDNKNQPFQLNLDLYDSLGMQSARQILAASGDDDFAFIPRIDSAGAYDPSLIQYFQKDSLGFVVYEYASKEDSTKKYYNLGFSYVGPENGNYIQLLSNANGKVFQWVEPIGGVPAGQYEPVEILIAPSRMQMLNIGVEYEIGENTRTSLELVRTNNDLNTFSPVDESDDVGYGLRYDFSSLKSLSQKPKDGWKVATKVYYEHTQKNFRYVERYRNVEFDRSWNRTLENPGNQQPADENIARADLTFYKGKKLQIQTRQSWYSRGGEFGGYAQNYNARWTEKKWRFRAGLENVATKIPVANESLDNRFNNISGELEKRGKWVNSTVSWRRESSSFGRLNDTLHPQSYSYEQRRIDLGSGDSLQFNWRLVATQRLDFTAGEGGEYQASTDGRDASFQLDWKNKRSTVVNLTATYRELRFDDSTLNDENTTQGRVEVRQDFLKKVIRTTTYYQVGTGQEQRREFSFLEVGDGNGAYIWNDYDENGVQSLNEFELASDFDRGRANFIRQFLPVQGFIKSYSSEFNHNFRFRPSVVLRKSKKPYLKFLGRFSNVTAIKIQKKVTDNTPDIFLNPWQLNITDTILLSTNSAIRSVFSFNQSSPIFGIDYQWLSNENKQLLVNGVDTRSIGENKLKVRYNASKNWEINLTGSAGERGYASAFLTDRSYQYNFQSIRPKIGYQYKRNLRVEFYYDYFEATNLQQYGGEQTFNHDLTTELRLNVLNQGSIRLSFGVVNINYRGDDNSPVAYELLNGLKNGRNAKWNLQMEQRFSNSIQLLISYDGRQSFDSPIIHIGRVQARYLF